MNCISCTSTKLKKAVHLVDVPPTTQVLRGDNIKKDKKISLYVYSCGKCSLFQLSKKVNLKDAYYEDYLIDRKFSSFSNTYQKALAKKFVTDFKLNRKDVLEVACGDGYFADLLKKEGARVLGIEPSETGYKLTKKRGIKVVQMYVNEKLRLPRKFHAFTACQILEHMVEPQKFLEILYSFLLPGGVGLIEVPSFSKTLAEKRFNDFIPDHVAYYTPSSLSYVLNAAGFRIVDIQEAMNGEYLSARVMRPMTDKNNLQKDFSIFRSKIKDFLKGNKGKRIIAWGAGIRGIPALSYGGLSSKLVTYCIDSDPAKHGFFLPGSHIEVVGPDILKKNSFDTVIITAELYADEITLLLRKTYKYKGRIAVLFPEPRYIKS